MLLTENVIKIWYHDEELKNMYFNLVESTPNSIKEVIEAKGELISTSSSYSKQVKSFQ